MQWNQELHFIPIIFEKPIRYPTGGKKQIVVCMNLEFWGKIRHTFFHLNETYFQKSKCKSSGDCVIKFTLTFLSVEKTQGVVKQ